MLKGRLRDINEVDLERDFPPEIVLFCKAALTEQWQSFLYYRV